MQELVSITLIGVSLSMDTFSLSLSMGSLIKNNKFLNIFPFIVGIFHYIMPILGNKIGTEIINYFDLASNILLGLVLIILGINFAINYFKNEDININLNFISTIFLAFSVSIDSFTVGLVISKITNNQFLSSLIFSLCSFFFTSIGLLIGKYSSKYIGKYANFLGIILLILLGLYHIF